MSRVTSKLQVTVPKAIADRYGIRPGDEIEWLPAGESIRIIPPGRQVPSLDLDTRLRMFDAATARQQHRQRHYRKGRGADRGWTREQLYEHGRAR
ncbi:MAG: AbrB/MazE/SpoVT family DNA-binding domain-containing protein [Candidatus Rokuibacteriota bacterium]